MAKDKDPNGDLFSGIFGDDDNNSGENNDKNFEDNLAKSLSDLFSGNLSTTLGDPSNLVFKEKSIPMGDDGIISIKRIGFITSEPQDEEENESCPGPLNIYWTLENKKKVLKSKGYRVVKDFDNEDCYFAVDPNKALSLRNLDPEKDDIDIVFENVIQDLLIEKLL